MTADAAPGTLRFCASVPPADAIQAHSLAVHTVAVLDEARDAAFQYPPIGRYLGDPALRGQLGALHGADPDAIFVGNGSLQVLDLLVSLLLRSGEPEVWVESPTYDRALEVFGRHGVRLVGIPVESDGLDVEALRQRLRSGSPAFVYTIPDFQNPTGVTMTESKREALVELAATYGFAIVQDILYRDLRYHGSMPPSLAELAGLGPARVISLASLSTVLSPGLRIGYAISDPETAHALAALAESTYLSPAPLCQAVAARCLAGDVMLTTVGRIRHLLRPRHDAAVTAVRRRLGGALVTIPDGGYYLGVQLRVQADEAALLGAARAQGIALTRGSAFHPPCSPPPPDRHFLRLPFHALEPDDFAYGVDRLAQICAQFAGSARS
ncbi:MAG: 2-aminoadipate transaminase [Mycobacteriales bacterium]